LAKELLAKHNPFPDLGANEGDAAEMMEAMMRYMPLRAMVNFSMGAFTEEMLTDMIQKLNEYNCQAV
jgi:beta-glucosidase